MKKLLTILLGLVIVSCVTTTNDYFLHIQEYSDLKCESCQTIKALIVSSNADWESSTNADWITIRPENNSNKRQIIVHLYVDQNTSKKTRIGEITIIANVPKLERRLIIIQKGWQE